MEVDQKLYEAAKELLAEHPDQAASACYLDDGEILTGVSTNGHHGPARLCAETGPICIAQKLKKKIAASICIANSDEGDIIVYTPCGICQERFFWFGGETQVAIPQKGDSTKWQSVSLKQVQPYWWKSTDLG